MAGAHARGRGRRAEDFAVRRWLQAGAVSVGMGAALLGFSLMGPSPTASADSADESSASVTSDAGGAVETTSWDREDPGSEQQSEASDAPDTEPEAELDDTEDDDTEEDAHASGIENLAAAEDLPGVDDGASARLIDTPETDAELETSLLSTATGDDGIPAAPTPSPYVSPQSAHQRWVARVLDDWTTKNQAWVDSLDVSDERKEELQASFLAMRRTFFNQAPTVAPIQLTGLVSGAITGRIDGEDADGDRIVYRLVRGPRQGSVLINGDGTYTYTPGAEFDGVDTFTVSAIDIGVHVNLLNVFRPIGARVNNLINQNAIRFQFTYSGADWTADRRKALEEVAVSLLAYFRVDRPVTLTYKVNLEDPQDPDRGLASAYSPNLSTLPGYWRTVVQHKLLTGWDANGSRADGEISWNWADSKWALGDEVASDEVDFVSTAMHELMHSFGFLTSLRAPGENRNRNRTYYDRFIVTEGRSRPFFSAQWLTSNDPKLTGGEGGLYFGGRNAVKAYGALVPLYTPAEFSPGSSVHHIDDETFTGENRKIMNAYTEDGPGVRVFSALEIGILRDLGFNVVMPESPPYATALVGFVFLLRRRRPDRTTES